jgi:hypothetical protein
MPTTITKSIGTSARDYSTIAAWEAAAPASIVATDEIWRGEMYNDSEFVTAGDVVNFAGVTVDATRYRELTVAAGQSFQDHASVRTNALVYDASKGVGLRTTGTYNIGVDANERYARISRFQVKMAGANQGQAIITGQDSIAKDILVDHGSTNSGAFSYVVQSGNDAMVINVVGFVRGANGRGFSNSYNGHFINCTLVKASDVTDTGGYPGYRSNYATHLEIQNCACFGFPTFTNATTTLSGDNNATNLASGAPGAGSQHSVAFSATAPFVQASTTSTDLKAKTAGALAALGVKDGTNAPNDISATVRASSCTIGAWEISAGGGGGAVTLVQLERCVRGMARGVVRGVSN